MEQFQGRCKIRVGKGLESLYTINHALSDVVKRMQDLEQSADVDMINLKTFLMYEVKGMFNFKLLYLRSLVFRRSQSQNFWEILKNILRSVDFAYVST